MASDRGTHEPPATLEGSTEAEAVAAPGAVAAERSRREAMWNVLVSGSDPRAVRPDVLSAVGLRPHQTVQGIFRDKEHTAPIAPPHGITLSVLHTGRSYDDAFDDEGGSYRYPVTNRAGRDRAEIEATKNAGRLRMPVFVVLRGVATNLREIRKGWVADWNDEAGAFLISFATAPVETRVKEGQEFSLRGVRRAVRSVVGRPRPGQARFRFEVFRRYGVRCALCPVAVSELLEAVHLCAVSEGGTDDSRNGLVLCRNHHRALDEGLVTFEPGTGRVICRRKGPTASQLGILMGSLGELPAQPHADAVLWSFSRFVRANGTSGHGDA